MCEVTRSPSDVSGRLRLESRAHTESQFARIEAVYSKLNTSNFPARAPCRACTVLLSRLPSGKYTGSLSSKSRRLPMDCPPQAGEPYPSGCKEDRVTEPSSNRLQRGRCRLCLGRTMPVAWAVSERRLKRCLLGRLCFLELGPAARPSPLEGRAASVWVKLRELTGRATA